MKHRKISLTTLFTIIFCVLLLAANVVLGAVLMGQSTTAMKSLIKKNMLAVVNTAAYVNGDVLDRVTAEDVGSEEYNHIADTLMLIKNAQHDNDIKYIYIIDKIDGDFVYIVDPDPEDPADFGEEIVYTPTQEIAFGGEAAIDSEPVEDEWGCFYSAWSPVYNSAGKVAGIVGIDFAADWYDSQVVNNTRSIVIASVASIVVGILVIFIMFQLLRKRFATIQKELTALSSDLDKLSDEFRTYPDMKLEYYLRGNVNEKYFDSGTDIVNSLSRKINVMQAKLNDYLDFVHKQAYTDSMTKVENKTAYLERIKHLNEQVADKTADFAVIIFDINGLKNTNDNYGHECGDQIIVDTAALVRDIFKNHHVYRIGGDEFISIVDNATEDSLGELFKNLQKELDAFNKEYATGDRLPLSFSYGSAIYDKDKDALFKDVFKRADQEMYVNKNRFYKSRNQDPSRNYET